jgi:hypothetical protein
MSECAQAAEWAGPCAGGNARQEIVPCADLQDWILGPRGVVVREKR